MDTKKRDLKHIQELALRCLLFEDGVVLLEESREELNWRLDIWGQALEAYDFGLIKRKTKYKECNFCKNSGWTVKNQYKNKISISKMRMLNLMSKCFELDDDDDPHGLNGWNWQYLWQIVLIFDSFHLFLSMVSSCIEMFMPMSSSQKPNMFPPYEVKPRPKRITTKFGGHNIHATLKKFGSALHIDSRASTENDPDWLVEQRATRSS
ncbi:hypothetical protein MTR_8g072340 [Medicago truncatula]|uniref:Uncharacterized protein n=1 Tax=Medicago truncatula TaxID=3880 RepID=G7L7V2_MEDTR|nr:hypothetical protein MTR_8g072340 [Medicago truncatula]